MKASLNSLLFLIILLSSCKQSTKPTAQGTVPESSRKNPAPTPNNEPTRKPTAQGTAPETSTPNSEPTREYNTQETERSLNLLPHIKAERVLIQSLIDITNNDFEGRLGKTQLENALSGEHGENYRGQRVTYKDSYLIEIKLIGPNPAHFTNGTAFEPILKGPLPNSFSTLIKIKRLELQNNELSGEIPESIGNLSDLEHLNLSSNKLEGIPPLEALKKLRNLKFLNLSKNTRLQGLDSIKIDLEAAIPGCRVKIR